MKTTISIPKPASSTWTVKGTTIPELFKNLEKHKWWGRYRSNEAFKAKKRNKEKLIEEIVISGKPLIIMPKWAEYGKASKEEKQSWDKMWKALHAHEIEHHEKFEEHAKNMKNWLAGMDPLSDKDMKSEWTTFKDDLQKDQKTFDKRTKNGARDGVVLDQV